MGGPTVEDDPLQRKARGAFFTPPAIASFLARWAVGRNPAARVLDPSCGEAVFLTAAGRELTALGRTRKQLRNQLFGVDVHQPSLDRSLDLLAAQRADAHLVHEDFFSVPPPGEADAPFPAVDAVLGNPPFIRYQDHGRKTRNIAAAAALHQGVRLSNLASSWAALLVHAAGFLKEDGRLAMVLPAELLTVHYAEPVRRWLRERFAGVTLVLFDELQFEDALERVVLVLAHGNGGCDSFNLVYVRSAEELEQLHVGDGWAASPASEGKWTNLLLSVKHRQLYGKVSDAAFVSLSAYGAPELGSVTGANDYFTMTEPTRRQYELVEDLQVKRICPPGSRFARGITFSLTDWQRLRDEGERVWLFWPQPDDEASAVAAYKRLGIDLGIAQGYKCTRRTYWWRSHMVSPPDMFFTYMSHQYPRLVTNTANVTCLNSMHGVRLRAGVPKKVKAFLPLLMMNSVSMLGAEVHGRSYGGGVLKMEPREAALLPAPKIEVVIAAGELLRSEHRHFDQLLRSGLWTDVAKRVDEVLLQQVLGLNKRDVTELRNAAAGLRSRRTRQ